MLANAWHAVVRQLSEASKLSGTAGWKIACSKLRNIFMTHGKAPATDDNDMCSTAMATTRRKTASANTGRATNIIAMHRSAGADLMML
jgi:hypothetical protein